MNTRVSLKNIKNSQCDIYFDNKKVGYAYCHCGPTDCSPYDGKDDLFNEMVKYCASLPPTIFYGLELESNLGFVVDNLFSDFLKAKQAIKNL